MAKFDIFSNACLGSVKCMTQNGKFYFRLNDLCACLDIANPYNIAKYLKDLGDNHRVKEYPVVSVSETVKTGTRKDGSVYEQKSDVNYVTKTAMYLVMRRSDKKEAEDFYIWIAEDVLPKLEENSVYVMGEEDMTDEEADEVHRKIRPVVEKAVKKNPMKAFFGQTYVARDGSVFFSQEACIEYNRSL